MEKFITPRMFYETTLTTYKFQLHGKLSTHRFTFFDIIHFNVSCLLSRRETGTVYRGI